MTAPQHPIARDDLAVVELDGEAVIYDPKTGDLHHLNPVATLVFALCDGSGTTREVAADIADVTGEPKDEVERQVRRFLRELSRAGLLSLNGRVHG